MQSVLNTVKGTALNVAEYLTPVLKVSIKDRKYVFIINRGGWVVGQIVCLINCFCIGIVVIRSWVKYNTCRYAVIQD